MQTNHHHPAKAVLKPHVAAEAKRSAETPRKQLQKIQNSGLSREELRQIVIDMIG